MRNVQNFTWKKMLFKKERQLNHKRKNIQKVPWSPIAQSGAHMT